jgi:outer membrane immunogenic protein
VRRLQFAVLATAVLGAASSASAADMAMKAPVSAPASVNSWTGWYVGLNAGGDWGTSNSNLSADLVSGDFFGNDCQGPSSGCNVNIDDVAGAGRQRFRTSGFSGGVMGGYNWQSGHWLLGIETDFAYFRSAGSGTNSVSLVSDPLGSSRSIANISTSTDWLFTLRPRVGFVENNWLFYATGGLAVTQLRATWNWTETAFGTGESTSASSTRAGWTIGGGVETMLPQNWIVGAEYLYINVPGVSAHSSPVLDGTAPESFNHSADLQTNLVRVRISKKL